MQNAVSKTILLACRFFAVWVVLVVSPHPAQAANHGDLVLVDGQDRIPLQAHFDYAPDPGGQVRIEHLLAQPDLLAWQHNVRGRASFGFRRDAYWFRAGLRLQHARAETWLLHVDYALLSRLDVFLVIDGRVEQGFTLGDHQAFSQRPLRHHSFLVPLQLNPNQHAELLLRVQTDGSLQIPSILWRPKAFYEHEQLVNLGHGAFYGALFVMLAYNLFLFYSLRESAYLYYACYVSALGLMQASLHGFAFQFLWPHGVWWQGRSTGFFVTSTMAFAVLFVQSFLDTRHHHPKTHRLLYMAAWLAGILMLLGVVLPSEYMIRLDAGIVAPFIVTLFFVSLQSWSHGQQSARLLLFAWAAFLIGSLLMALNKFAVIPLNFMTEYAMQIGSFLEAILLSLALTDRIHEERNRHEQAQSRALALQQKARAELETRVSDRTRALRTAMVQLEHANTRLESLSTTDPLTGIGNRRYFDARFAKEWSRGIRTGLPLSILMIDVDHFKRLNDTYGHPVGDDCLEHIAHCIQTQVGRANDTVARYGGEEFVVILPHTLLADATSVAKRIHEAVGKLSIPADNDWLRVTVSIGVASCVPNQQLQADAIVNAADQKLYEAKHAGRNQVCVQNGERTV